MRGYVLVAEPLAQLMRDALGEAARIYDPQRRTMGIHQLHDALENLVPHFVRSNRAELGRGNLHAKIESALVSDVDDYRLGPRILRVSIARQETGDLFDRFLCRGKSDSHWSLVG